jgi:ribosome recycling factor
MPKTVIAQCEEKMLKTIESLKKDFTNIRTGKANPAILNSVMVSYYGVPTPVSQVGSVSVPDPQSIVVKPWDKSILKDIEKAIQQANLGLNPSNDGEVVRIPIPPLNEQTRKDLAKQAKKVAEDNKVAVRNVRRDGMEQLKKLEKDGLITEDELKRYNDQVQKLTDKYIANIDTLAKEKEQDIMSI